jgi:hydroxymethylpyrimidine/phosphomethylpyrimidine kinase
MRAGRPAVLVIAATDSSGGAGLTRDVRVLADLSVDALCVVTAVTAQSDKRVTAVHPVPPEVIQAQLAGAFDTRAIDAIKIGMLGNRATVEAVAKGLTAAVAETRIPVVLDPVLVSSSGGVLLDDAGRGALLDELLPRTTLLTPNVPETAALLGEAVARDEAELIQQGRRLLARGGQAILLKGGHSEGEDAVDVLLQGTEAGTVALERISSRRVAGTRRGTGCALASAIAAALACGSPLAAACRTAKSYVHGMLTSPS